MMSHEKPTTKAKQRAATMRNLIDVAREAFANEGYASASMEAIVGGAGVTRGALYHHFGSKEGLFRAVLEDVQAEVASRIMRAAEAQSDPWSQLVAGCHAFLQSSLDPGIQRMMLLDAPAVLGWETWREIDAENSGRLLEEILIILVEQGIIKPLPIAALTRLLSGAMNEAALWIAQSPEPHQSLNESVTTLEMLLSSLRIQ
jgi:AcrR family transcriptional regulator